MKTLNHVGDWISYKLDQIAKIFISKEDQIRIALEQSEANIENIVQGGAAIITMITAVMRIVN